MKCPKCGYNIKKRSTEISDRFHGWVTYIWQQYNKHYGYVSREKIKLECLLRACALDEPPEGGSPYPYFLQFYENIKENILVPESTSNRTNKQMITACMGVELYADELRHQGVEISELPEGE
jgi:hypothetical protein